MRKLTIDELIVLKSHLRRALSIKTGSTMRRRMLLSQLESCWASFGAQDIRLAQRVNRENVVATLKKKYAFISGKLADAQLDILSRLQFLEGAFRTKQAKEKLLWSKGNLRQGLQMATEYITENYGPPSEMMTYTWLAPTSTGFYRDVQKKIGPVLQGKLADPDDVMQMILIGMNPSGHTFYINENKEQIELDKLFQAAGFKSRHQTEAMLKGKQTPFDFSHIIAKWAERKALILVSSQTTEENKQKKYWGGKIRPQDAEGWEEDFQDVEGLLPADALHEDWGSRSEAWAFSSVVFHTNSPEGQRVKDWLYKGLFTKNTAVDATMRTLFDMLEEGTWDVEGNKDLTRQKLMNAELAKRVGKAIGRDMGPNEKGQYAKINAAREAGFKMIEQAMDGLRKQPIDRLKQEEANYEAMLKGFENREKGVPNPQAKAELSETHRAQQETRKAIKDLSSQIDTLTAQQGSTEPPKSNQTETAKKELQVTQRALNKQNKTLLDLRAQAQAAAQPPAAQAKALQSAQKGFEAAQTASTQANEEYLKLIALKESRPRVTKKLQTALDLARSLKRQLIKELQDRNKALVIAQRDANASAVVPKGMLKTLAQAETIAKELRSRVEKATAQVTSLGGSAPVDRTALETALTEARKSARAAKATENAKKKELADLQASAEAKPSVPSALKKSRAQAKQSVLQAKEIATQAIQEAADLQARLGKAKRPSPQLKESFAAAMKGQSKAKREFSRAQKELKSILAEIEQISTSAPDPAILAAAEKAYLVAQQNTKKALQTAKKLSAELLNAEVQPTATAGPSKANQKRQQEAIQNLEKQLEALREKSEQNKLRILALEASSSTSPLLPEEKQQKDYATKNLKLVQSKLSILKIVDDMDIAGMGLSGLRKGSRDTYKLFKRNSYLYRFFQEKVVPYKVFSVRGSQGLDHEIPNTVVIEHIAQARGAEQQKIEGILRKIDFQNGDVNHFLAHLAKAIAENYEGAIRSASLRLQLKTQGRESKGL